MRYFIAAVAPISGQRTGNMDFYMGAFKRNRIRHDVGQSINSS